MEGITRRSFLGGLAFTGGLGGQEKRPNILIFLSDQETARVDRRLLHLPNRGRLEARGVRFPNAWCATPQCSPARGTLWTGLAPHRSGVRTNIGAVGSKPLAPGTPTLGTAFQAAGYRTGYFGKWHLTAGQEIDGEAFGFDRAEGYAKGGDREVAERAAAWIQDQEGPWLAIVSVLQPHDVYDFPRLRSLEKPPAVREGIEPPTTTISDLSDRPAAQRAYVEQDQGQAAADYTSEDWRGYRSLYYDLIEDADRSFGVCLDAAGEDAIVVYTSDHGDGQGEHGLAFKGPFLYEELMNVPFVIAAPNVGGGRKSAELACHADLVPTICDLSQIEPPRDLDGISLRPALAGRATGREAIYGEYHSKQRWANPVRAVRTARWKLNVYLQGGRELYDLVDDPNERTNLAGKGLAEEARLEALLEDEAARTGDAQWFERRLGI